MKYFSPLHQVSIFSYIYGPNTPSQKTKKTQEHFSHIWRTGSCSELNHWQLEMNSSFIESLILSIDVNGSCQSGVLLTLQRCFTDSLWSPFSFIVIANNDMRTSKTLPLIISLSLTKGCYLRPFHSHDECYYQFTQLYQSITHYFPEISCVVKCVCVCLCCFLHTGLHSWYSPHCVCVCWWTSCRSDARAKVFIYLFWQCTRTHWTIKWIRMLQFDRVCCVI